MNIDLLLTNKGEAGLVCDQAAGCAVAGIMFDSDTGLMTIEYTDLDPLELNIPVDDSYIETLYYATAMQVGTIINGEIRESRQVPILLLNDPAANNDRARFAKPRASVLAFEHFLKNAVIGQPIHRDDLSDDSGSSVMGGMSAAVMKFAPNLVRQRTMEIAPTLAPKGPNAPGLGLGGGRNGNRSVNTGSVNPLRGRKPPTHRDGFTDDEQE
ncbi:MAG TPA: hypothetical protein VGD95_00535 [Micavibrio sp.]